MTSSHEKWHFLCAPASPSCCCGDYVTIGCHLSSIVYLHILLGGGSGSPGIFLFSDSCPQSWSSWHIITYWWVLGTSCIPGACEGVLSMGIFPFSLKGLLPRIVCVPYKITIACWKGFCTWFLMNVSWAQRHCSLCKLDFTDLCWWVCQATGQWADLSCWLQLLLCLCLSISPTTILKSWWRSCISACCHQPYQVSLLHCQHKGGDGQKASWKPDSLICKGVPKIQGILLYKSRGIA